jgi:hypothetical protein
MTPLSLSRARLKGFVVGMLDVVPVAVQYTDLPCYCEDEEYVGTALCQGRSTMCSISRFSVFLLMSMSYTMAGTVVRLLITIWRNRSLLRAFDMAYYPVFSVLVPFICAIAALALDFQPSDSPDTDLASLHIISDSFSCNPRFPTFLTDFVFVKGQFIFSAVLCFGAVANIIKKMLELSGAAGMRVTKKTGNESCFSKLPPVRFIRDLAQRLISQRAEKLVIMGTIVCVSLIINLYITISAAPVLEQFKLKTDEWRECNVAFATYCPG